MKKILLLSVLLLTNLLSFAAAVKVGESFTGSDGNTYKFIEVTINGKEDYYITVAITKCAATGDVTLPEKVTGPENYVCNVIKVDAAEAGLFSQPRTITSVTYPECIKEISGHVYRFTTLTTINLPASVEKIGTGIGNTYVEAFVVADKNPNYKTVDGVMYTKDSKVLVNYPSQKNAHGTFRIPNTTEKVNAGAFMYNTLETIEIPTSVAEWDFSPMYDNGASLKYVRVDNGNPIFYDVDGVLCLKDGDVMIAYGRARNAEEYTIPSPIKRVRTNAFISGVGPQRLIVGSSVKTLDKQAVYNIGNLKYVKLSKNTTDLTDGNPFLSCDNLSGVEVENGNPNYASIDNVLFTSNKETLVYYPVKHGGIYDIPTGTKYVAEQAFQSVTTLTKVTIPKTVEEIKTSAFTGCSSLSEVVFTDSDESSLKKVGGSAFNGCSALTTITLPSSTERIGSFAFYNTGLTSFEFPEGVTRVDRNALSQNKDLVSITLNENLTTIELGCFNDNPSLTSFDFNGNTKITGFDSGMFQNDTALETFTFPAQMTWTGVNSFMGCTNLKHVYFESDSKMQLISSSAFMNSGLVDITFPEGFKTVGSKAFENCTQLKEINFPSTVENLSYDMFTHCSGLEAINVAKGSTKYSSCDGFLLSKDKQTLIIFPAGKASEKFTLLPPSITTIGMYSFYDCANLEVVTIPKKVTSIESRAFEGCIYEA